MSGEFKPLAYKGLVIVNADPEEKAQTDGGAQLIAFDADTGGVRWKRSFRKGDFAKAMEFPDRCIRDGRDCIVLDAATGQPVARLAPPEDASGWKYLTAARDRLYGTSADGRTVFSVDAASGRRVWSRAIDGATFVPALAEGRLLLHTERGTLLALDARDGSELWRTQDSVPAGRASLHARSGRGVVLAESGKIMVFDTSCGRTVWRKELGEPPGAGLAMSSEAIYLQGGNRALALADGFTLWYQNPGVEGDCSPPTVVGRELLASAGPGHNGLAVLSQAGQVLGTVSRTAGGRCDGAIFENGRLFVMGDGCLLAVGRR